MGTITYKSNNSGGHWPLSDKDWEGLAAAGWDVNWFKDDDADSFGLVSGGRFLGALAMEATKANVSSMEEGVDEWEMITGCSSTDAGCPCCGQPHYFIFNAGDGKTEFGPHVSYEARW